MCHSWMTISPPWAWTASVVSFHPSTCSSLQIPGGGPARTFDADARRFGDDQPGTGALAVIGRHHCVGDRSGLGRTATRERGHENTVLRFERTHFQGLEQGIMHAGKSFLLAPLVH
jgi:hypothetical protein